MFLRLLIAFAIFGAMTAVAARVLHGALPGSTEFALILLSAGIVAAIPAWLLARKFAQPLDEIQVAASRMAEGEYEQRIHGGPLPEGRELARSFNTMSTRLVGTIERLESERQQLRAVLGGMVEGVVAVGSGQRVLFANEAAGGMLEFDPVAAVGRPLYEVSRQHAVQVLIEKAVRSQQAQREDMTIARPTARHLSVYVAPLTAESPGAVLVLHDTTEVRRLERLRQDFVANVSHELKTPLAVVKTCTEVLQDGAVDDPVARGPFLQQIADHADRLHALILDLLSLARIESGEAAMTFESIPVAEAVAACLDRLRPRAESKRMRLHAIPADPPLSVWADDESLGQILDNLVDNAVKYTQEGGEVRVSWRAGSPGVCLSVEDNGPGIPERDLPRVFERFYRVDRARSRELGGTGLGLSIVKHLAQAMGGFVRASSEVGRGTTFTVCLPVPIG